jgi:hypothetical protein
MQGSPATAGKSSTVLPDGITAVDPVKLAIEEGKTILK